MKNTVVLKLINPLLFLSMSVQVATGLVLMFGLFVSSPVIFSAITELHEHNAILLIILILIHLSLNWGWVRANFFKSS